MIVKDSPVGDRGAKIGLLAELAAVGTVGLTPGASSSSTCSLKSGVASLS